MNSTNVESLNAWEANAEFWDKKMGDTSNDFHNKVVRPHTEELLSINEKDAILDIACGNGNYAARLSEQCTKVVAFDYSPKMIELAKKRHSDVMDKVDFKVCDATSYEGLMQLASNIKFNKAVSNMAIMDISDIEPLFHAVFELLDKGGLFVFSTHHPCFTYPNKEYFTSCMHKGAAIEGQPVLQNYYHRSLQEILKTAFKCGFVQDGFYEVPMGESTTPIIIIVRLRKL